MTEEKDNYKPIRCYECNRNIWLAMKHDSKILELTCQNCGSVKHFSIGD